YNIEKLFYQIISKKKSPLKQGLSSASRLNSSLNFMVLTSKHGDQTTVIRHLYLHARLKSLQNK
ncbi:hypothetical protein MKC68_12065, partial [[Clostridium] innocuum]|nr:hypothetical protein [[Clostridium] innocuum]MCR0260260.1 hypothetical protein [[Clostridium] innocuum]